MSGLWGYLISGLVAVAGVVWGLFKHQEAKTATAVATTATNEAANAKADAEASQAALSAVQTAQTQKETIQADVSKTTGSALDTELKNEGFVG